MKKTISFYEQMMKFDFKSYKKEVMTFPHKYDNQKFIRRIRRARVKNKEWIRIWRGKIYLSDLYILEKYGCYHEDEEMGSCGWLCYIFLSKESHKKYLKDKENHLIKCLSSFREAGII